MVKTYRHSVSGFLCEVANQRIAARGRYRNANQRLDEDLRNSGPLKCPGQVHKFDY